MQALIEKVGPTVTEDDNLNGSSIIQDMLEIKEFYSIVSKRENVLKLAEYSFTPSGTDCQSS